MSAADVTETVRKWVTRAEGDLMSAEALVTAAVPLWSPAFHAQQCAEKYLIGELIALLPVGQRPSLPPAVVADLTEYAAAGRYPGSPEPSAEEVREAIEAVRTLRASVRTRLPPAALKEP